MAIRVCQKKIIHTKAEEVCQPASDPPNQAQLREEDATNHNVEEKLEVIDTPLTFTLANVKEKIRERLLKFQKKLVDVLGLPPTRLLQTPERSSDLGEARRRNLVTDFAKEDVIKKQHGRVLGEPFMHPTGSPSPAAPSVPMPSFNQTLGQGIGITSGSNRFSLRCVPVLSPLLATLVDQCQMVGLKPDQCMGMGGTSPRVGMAPCSSLRIVRQEY